jgi:structural maintenance of chromosome 2
VSSLQELVYKNGQAGITKASVAIVFDNRDKETSPYSYRTNDEITVTRQVHTQSEQKVAGPDLIRFQVVVGGRNKYLINGFQAQQSQVQTLFHSVGLNVNNPHFLIMQGRITKVLNMKPHEILQLLEEAAGTRMFETKKEAAMKTMEKKEQKMAEIQKVLDEDIRPTLERLREDRTTYLEFTDTQAEIEKLQRVLMAVDFYMAEVGSRVSLCVSAGGVLTGVQRSESQAAAELEAAARRLQERKAEAREKSAAASEARKRLQEETDKREKVCVYLVSRLDCRADSQPSHPRSKCPRHTVRTRRHATGSARRWSRRRRCGKTWARPWPRSRPLSSGWSRRSPRWVARPLFCSSLSG